MTTNDHSSIPLSKRGPGKKKSYFEKIDTLYKKEILNICVLFFFFKLSFSALRFSLEDAKAE